jgi:type VI secretion system protein ImpG
VRDELLGYYERELTYLRQMGGDFAERYPKIASRQLGPTVAKIRTWADDRIVRLVGGARSSQADDEFPEITQALLNVVPALRGRCLRARLRNSTRPARGKRRRRCRCARGAARSSRAACRASSPVTIRTLAAKWPAQWSTPDRVDPPIKAPNRVAALRLLLRCFPGTSFAELGPKRLRFYLAADSAIAYTLYELLANNCQDILLRDPRPKFRGRPIPLPLHSLRPVGFGPDEARCFSARSLKRIILQEYFRFGKISFSNSRTEALAGGFTDSAEACCCSTSSSASRQESLEAAVNANTFRLGARPRQTSTTSWPSRFCLRSQLRISRDCRHPYHTRAEVFHR